MTIYVQSRGKSQEHDHSWLEVTKGIAQTSIIPEKLKAMKPEELIDSQKSSIVLARLDEHLVLIITALDAPGRTDFMRRQICNTVAWIEPDNSKNERLFCKVAAHALNEKLGDDVHKAVFDDPVSTYGFRS